MRSDGRHAGPVVRSALVTFRLAGAAFRISSAAGAPRAGTAADPEAPRERAEPSFLLLDGGGEVCWNRRQQHGRVDDDVQQRGAVVLPYGTQGTRHGLGDVLCALDAGPEGTHGLGDRGEVRVGQL